MKDLEKALSPEIWPIRVRVREYVHYSNKKKQSNSSQVNNGYQTRASEFPPIPNRQGQNYFTSSVQGRNNLMVPTFNRFESLRNNGGPSGGPNGL